MGYPQPDANTAVARALDYFRLKTPLVSPGDIYESAQGGFAFAIGPQSDIARVTVVSFDANPGKNDPVTNVITTDISPQRAFVGKVPARQDVTYQPSGRKARTLFYVADLYDPDYRPEKIDPVAGQILRVTPELDVFQYFTPIQSLTPGRDDREFYFQNIPPPAGFEGTKPTYVVLPYYGRAYAYIDFSNFSGSNVSFGVIGTNYAITNDFVVGPTPIHQETNILIPVVVSNNGHRRLVIRSSVDGMFDALVISLEGNPGTPTPLKIVMSDTPQ